jgi:hypothetical protein
MTYIATFTIRSLGCRVLTGATVDAIRAAWFALCADYDLGASDLQAMGAVLLGNELVGWMSYNGRVWPRPVWQPGDLPVMEAV